MAGGAPTLARPAEGETRRAHAMAFGQKCCDTAAAAGGDRGVTDVLTDCPPTLSTLLTGEVHGPGQILAGRFGSGQGDLARPDP